MKKKQMNHSELVALALLEQGPQHPYELNRQIDDMQVRQWAKIGASTLYVTLDRLAKNGDVRETVKQVGARPPRKIYSITAKGRRTLQRLIAAGLRSSAAFYSDKLVAAVFQSLLGDDAAKHVDEALDELRSTQSRLADAASTPGISEQGNAIIEFQLKVAKAELEAVKALTKAK